MTYLRSCLMKSNDGSACDWSLWFGQAAVVIILSHSELISLNFCLLLPSSPVPIAVLLLSSSSSSQNLFSSSSSSLRPLFVASSILFSSLLSSSPLPHSSPSHPSYIYTKSCNDTKLLRHKVLTNLLCCFTRGVAASTILHVFVSFVQNKVKLSYNSFCRYKALFLHITVSAQTSLFLHSKAFTPTKCSHTSFFTEIEFIRETHFQCRVAMHCVLTLLVII